MSSEFTNAANPTAKTANSAKDISNSSKISRGLCENFIFRRDARLP